MKTLILYLVILLPFLTLAEDGSSNLNEKQKLKKAERDYKIAKELFFENKYDSTSFYLFDIISKTKRSSNINVKSHILLGYIFSNTEKYSNSEKYLKIALKNTTDNFLKSQIFINLGDLYFKMEKPQLALTFFKKALQIMPKIDNLDYQIVHSNIGAAYIQLKNPKKALSYINKAHKIAISINDSLGQSICINNLATIHRDLNQTDLALFYYKQALKMVDEFSSKEEKKTILFNLSELYQKKGNATLALIYFKKYAVLKDELFNSEKHEFIVETQEKYEATERKREIAELKISEQEKEAKNFKLQVGIVVSALLLIVILLALNYRNRSKKKEEEHKTKLALITATLYGEENQRLKISQEIHDDLGGILGMSRMLFTKSKLFFINQNIELFDRIDSLLIQANNRSRAISHELFSPTLKQYGLQVALEEYITNLRYVNHDLEIKFNMDDFRLDAQLELNFFRITQELFTNTIKYANASSILLKISKTQNTLNYTYQDNGKGFDFQNITKGVGLNSIEARVKSFDGTISYTPANEGFFVKISIPLK